MGRIRHLYLPDSRDRFVEDTWWRPYILIREPFSLKVQRVQCSLHPMACGEYHKNLPMKKVTGMWSIVVV
jgi:hypothetical protein